MMISKSLSVNLCPYNNCNFIRHNNSISNKSLVIKSKNQIHSQRNIIITFVSTNDNVDLNSLDPTIQVF